MADHLLGFEADARMVEEKHIDDAFQYESVMVISKLSVLRYADFSNFNVFGQLPNDLNSHLIRKSLLNVKKYIWDKCVDNIIPRCMPEVEVNEILEACHASPTSATIGAFVQLLKFYNVSIMGLHCLGMPTHF